MLLERAQKTRLRYKVMHTVEKGGGGRWRGRGGWRVSGGDCVGKKRDKEDERGEEK